MPNNKKNNIHIVKTRIYGVDPGFLRDNGECIKNCSNGELFKAIYCLKTRIWVYNNPLLDNNLIDNPIPNLLEPKYTYNFCIYQLKVRGILDLHDPVIDQDYEDCDAYEEWLEDNKEYFKTIDQELAAISLPKVKVKRRQYA